MLSGFFQCAIQKRNQALSTFEGKGFCSRVLLSNKLFENGCVGKFCVDASLDLVRKCQSILCRLHATLKPIANVAIVDVHELCTDAAAIGVSQFFDDVRKSSAIGILERWRRKRSL